MKLKSILLLLLTAMVFAACSDEDEPGDYNFLGDPVEPGKTLVVYFTRTNNTQRIANHINDIMNVDMYQIQVVNPYPEDYDQTTQVAQQEKNNNARPEIANLPENIDEYETIIIGFPIWWGSRPMVIATFLEAFDFTGKNIVPFCTHGGGGVSQAFTEVQAHTPNSVHLQGLVQSGGGATRGTVENWLNSIFILE
jgi:flavodoxin